MMRQKYDQLNASDRIKNEFISRVNHIENRQYFYRKRKSLEGAPAYIHLTPDKRDRTQDEREFSSGSGITGVRLPHKLRQQSDSEVK
jgi:hypothetical protein